MRDKSPTHQATGGSTFPSSAHTEQEGARAAAGCALPLDPPEHTSGEGPAQVPLTAPPSLSYVKAGEGLELGSHAFLRPLPPCCSMIASPYWARIIGDVSNHRDAEVLVKVVATLFDAEGFPVGVHDDFMVLDAEQKSEFDIKIGVFYENVSTYGLETVETEEF
jgi:hypothetical protein